VIGDLRQDADEAFLEVIEHYFGRLNQPAMNDFLFGHCRPNFSVPLGIGVLLNANQKQLWIQPGVKWVRA
jgi:muramoyltetrapeptide carboxypeptidase